MTNKHDDGGPAYPRQYDDVRHDGETIWDRYAAAALQGVLARDASNDSFAATVEVAKDNGLTRTIAVAMIAAEHADAMLAERRKRGIGQ